MEIVKTPNFRGDSNNIELIKDGKTLCISYERVLDYYLHISDGTKMPFKENAQIIGKEIDFDIDINDGDVYKAFDALYTDIINCNPWGKPLGKKKKFKIDSNDVPFYQKLVNTFGNIIYVGEQEREDNEDYVVISKTEKGYKLTFVRTERQFEYGFKDKNGITIRITTSGSRYDKFFMPFQRLYVALQTAELPSPRKSLVIDQQKTSTC